MRFILNVIWLLFGGLFMALGYLLAGVIMCILIITIPFGIAAFRLGSYARDLFHPLRDDGGRRRGRRLRDRLVKV